MKRYPSVYKGEVCAKTAAFMSTSRTTRHQSRQVEIDGLIIGDFRSVKNQDRVSSSSYVQNESMLGTIHVYPYSPIP